MAAASLAVPLLALTLGTGPAGASNSDNQAHLSGTGVSTSFSPQGVDCTCSGYWLWSEPSGTNSYGGSAGNGSGDMYIYPFGINSPVDISNVAIDASAGTVSEDVHLLKPNLWCHFTATETSKNHGTISYSCPDVPVPAQFGGGTTTVSSTATAVVGISNYQG